jgi:hypothetical protein
MWLCLLGESMDGEGKVKSSAKLVRASTKQLCHPVGNDFALGTKGQCPWRSPSNNQSAPLQAG